MEAPPEQSASLDLNIIPFALVVPKIEPMSDPVDVKPQIGPIVPLPSPNSDGVLSPEVHTPLQQLPPNEDDLFAEYYRLAQLFLSSYTDKLRSAGGGGNGSIFPLAGNGSVVFAADGSGNSALVVPRKKHKVRSGEMVRVSSISAQNHRSATRIGGAGGGAEWHPPRRRPNLRRPRRRVRRLRPLVLAWSRGGRRHREAPNV